MTHLSTGEVLTPIKIGYRTLCRRLTRNDWLFEATRHGFRLFRWATRRLRGPAERPRRETRFPYRLAPPALLPLPALGEVVALSDFAPRPGGPPTVSVIISGREDSRKLGCLLYYVERAAGSGSTVELIFTPGGVQSGVLGKNRAARQARGRYLFFVREDAVMLGDCIAPMRAFMEKNEHVGAVGPMVLRHDGSVQELGYMIDDDMCPGQNGRFEYPDDPHYQRPHRVDFALSSCLMTRRELFIQVGGFSEYPGRASLWSDLDYGLKLRSQGTTFYALPAARVYFRRFEGEVPLGRRSNSAYRKIRRVWASRKIELFKSSPNLYAHTGAQMYAEPTVAGTIAVHLHLYYIDLTDEFVGYLSRMPYPFDLFVSVLSEEDRQVALHLFKAVPRIGRIDVRIVPNRGRDIAPLVCEFGKDLLKYDYICHIHSKKSVHTPGLSSWRSYLLENLFPSPAGIKTIFNLFGGRPKVGMLYPPPYPELPWNWNTWGANRNKGQEVLERLGIADRPEGYIEFPSGSMFWARSAALSKLLKAGFRFEYFDKEKAQNDGTLAHVLERVFVAVAEDAGFGLAVWPAVEGNRV